MVVSTLVYAEPADSSRRMQAIILMYLLRMQTGCTVHIPCLSGDIPRQGQPFPLPMKNEDYNGDGKPDGRVYVYFTYNVYPGGISFISDEPGQTEGKAEDL